MVETVEIIVYITIAVIVGALIIGFIVTWDSRQTYEDFRGALGDSREESYEQISRDELARVALDLWDRCAQGAVALNKTVLVSDSGLVNKSTIFDTVRAAHLCRSLQSAAESCGTREDIVFSGVQAPVVLSLRCNVSSKRLVITN